MNVSTKLFTKYLSNSDALMLLAMADGWPSPNLNTLSMTDSSVLVVSKPQKEAQSLTTMPAPTTSLPLLTVPACGDFPPIKVTIILYDIKNTCTNCLTNQLAK